MIRVGIVFKNGEKVSFSAQEFDVDLSTDTLGEARYNEVVRFEYKDERGQVSPLYLTPNEVAGIAVAQINSSGRSIQFG